MAERQRPNALVFREAASAVPQIIEQLFNDDAKRPKIKATSINSRETVKKIYKERGDSTQTALPVIACKLTQLGILQEAAVNQFSLKHSGAGLVVAEDGKKYRFYGKQVLMQYQLTLFTNSYDDIMTTAAELLLMKSELSVELRIDPGIIFPAKISFDTSGFSIPDLSQEADITKFEFEFPGMQINTFVGRIENVSDTRIIGVRGGPVEVDSEGRRIVIDRDTFNSTIEVSE